MALVMAVIGFISGFCAGQMVLMFMLRHKSNEDLKKDRSLKIYGILNWTMAGLGAYTFMAIFEKYFG